MKSDGKIRQLGMKLDGIKKNGAQIEIDPHEWRHFERKMQMLAKLMQTYDPEIHLGQNYHFEDGQIIYQTNDLELQETDFLNHIKKLKETLNDPRTYASDNPADSAGNALAGLGEIELSTPAGIRVVINASNRIKKPAQPVHAQIEEVTCVTIIRHSRGTSIVTKDQANKWKPGDQIELSRETIKRMTAKEIERSQTELDLKLKKSKHEDQD